MGSRDGDTDGGGDGTSFNDPTSSLNPNNLNGPNSSLNNFLSTVDLAGIPENMSVGYLNDPGRQTALSHLRKQMMASRPDECMLCNTDLATPGDIRFCPCCAMVACAACVGRRVFELSSRKVVSVCLHCYGSSSRIRHPPSTIKDSKHAAKLNNQWWTQDDLKALGSPPVSADPSLSPDMLSGGGRPSEAIGTLGAIAEAIGDFSLAQAIGGFGLDMENDDR